MAKTLITGATGFLGSHLLELLLDRRKDEIRVLSMSSQPELATRGVEVIEGSISSPGVVERAVEGVKRIYHLAGKVSRNPDDQRELYEVHVEGTRLLCQEARRAAVERVVLASSSGTIAVTEDGQSIPDESWPTPLHIIARWPYYASKVYQETVARQECKGGPDLVILNPSLLLGPGDERLSSTEDILKFLSRDVPAVPPGGLNFVDVRDVAPAFVAAMERGAAGDRYLIGGPNWDFAKLFSRLERLTKVPAPRLHPPGAVIEWGARAVDSLYRHWGKASPVDRISVEMSRYFWYLDASKAERELGFRSRDPGDTLYETVAYLREHFLGNEAFRASGA
jgi:dihydroflavonol-4-reductase